MGRESSDALEQAALSFLSGIDPELGLDAALFVRRTGLVLASWMREGIRLDVVSVMAATMLASVSMEITSGVGPPTDSMIVSTDASIVGRRAAARSDLHRYGPPSDRRDG